VIESSYGTNLKPTLIVGANSKSASLIKMLLNKEMEYFPFAIICDQKASIGTYISNVKVFSFEKAEELIKENEIKDAIITKELNAKELDEIFEKLYSYGVENIKLFQTLTNKEELKDISIEDLLARKPKDLDSNIIQSFIKDRVILITGAGGSIGSEIARQTLGFGAKRLILVDNSEYNLYKIEQELNSPNITPLLKDVTKIELLEDCFKENKIDIVIHAAAYKHVPLVELNKKEAVINNILGTKNVIDLSIKYEVKKFILISTDKAVRPTNVMGATKRVCELYAQNVKSNSCVISSVRFGNVLGSSGSVIPKFKECIEKDLPLPVTHPEIRRYFMLIPEACQLVLQAATLAKGGETYVLDMGESVKIVDLAKKMLRLYGKSEDNIIFTGLRPAEKLYEELLIEDGDKKTKFSSIFIGKRSEHDIQKLNQDIESLLNCKEEEVVTNLKKIVPEFNHLG
jgi:UDP-N-acetyl-D-glucosamine 4,6-dehydratase